MARPSSPPILAQIRNPGSQAEQITALRALKNELIGHQQKKEMWVGLGIVEPIVRVLISSKLHGRQDGMVHHDQGLASESIAGNEMARLQALHIIGSLAHGGPSFLLPLSSAAALPAVLSNLCPSKNPPQLVLAALRALCNLADSVMLASNLHPLNGAALADLLFLRPHVSSLYRILSQSSSTSTIQTQISLAASLLHKLCQDERHQSSLANAGILDALATRLASIIVSQGLVIPGAELVAHRDGLQECLSSQAPSNADLAGILGAISVVIADSKLRASQLVYSCALRTVFPSSAVINFHPNRCTRAERNAYNATEKGSRQVRLNAVDYLIPHVPFHPTKATSAHISAFPPLGAQGSFEHLIPLGRPKDSGWPRPSSSETESTFQDISDATDEAESALIAYLIWLTRSSKDNERLMAASVLTILYRAGLTNKTRETALGLLIVPILVQLLDADRNALGKFSEFTSRTPEAVSKEWMIEEQTPAVLAMLIVDSEYLQKCAYDAGIIVKLSKMLKTSYDPVIDTSESRTWSPNSNAVLETEVPHSVQSSRLGPLGCPALLVHRIKVRESTLRAIAALVPFKDEYRKALIDRGVVPYIVESLNPFPDRPMAGAGEKPEKSNQGSGADPSRLPGFGNNPVSVLVAACGAVRHLSRSVSILRTTLIDNGVVMPVFDLLQHSDIDVQISATAAVCNLVMDFSPMRETISAVGVLKILCEHAHSGNVKLRLNALWALKHLVQSAGNDVKKTCLEELGQGWLIQLICDDTEDDAPSSARALSGSSARMVDVDEDVTMDRVDDEDEFSMTDSIGALGNQSAGGFCSGRQGSVHFRPTGGRGASAIPTNSRLAELRDLETHPSQSTREENIAVQEQGLDFIRNLIGGFNNVGASETSEMIDFIFGALGQDQIFEILASKLRSRASKPVNKRNSSSHPDTRVQPQPEIITAVEYILVHMAASVPRHRQLVIAQTDLLKLLVPQFSHSGKEVRLALCRLVINLTCIDDTNDSQACGQRAQELKKLGFLTELEHLENDAELDVRERAKTAVWQIKQVTK